jgi:hypothetical protein
MVFLRNAFTMMVGRILVDAHASTHEKRENDILCWRESRNMAAILLRASYGRINVLLWIWKKTRNLLLK